MLLTLLPARGLKTDSLETAMLHHYIGVMGLKVHGLIVHKERKFMLWMLARERLKDLASKFVTSAWVRVGHKNYLQTNWK
jgi:hypothetical protein